MKNIYKIIAVLAAAAAASACVKDWKESRTGLSLSLNPDQTYVTKADVALEGPDKNAFDVRIRKNTGEYDKSAKYGELPAMIELSEGKYTVEVSSPDKKPVAWNQPIYAVSQEFTILDGSVTDLKLVCPIQNMKVTVTLSENMINELDYYEVIVENKDGMLVWKETEIKAGNAGFFSVNPLKVTVRGRRKLDGTQAVKELKIAEVAARDHHKLMIDAKLTGQAKPMELVIDNTLVDKPLDVVIPGFDEVVDGGETPGGGGSPVDPVAAPTLEWPANPDFTPLDITDDMNVELIVKVPGKIQSFIVRVSENFQSAIEMVASHPYLDLINDRKAIENLGSKLPAGDQLKGRTEVNFPLSALIPLISTVGNPGEDYLFTLEVGDEAGNQLSQTLTFHLPAAPAA